MIILNVAMLHSRRWESGRPAQGIARRQEISTQWPGANVLTCEPVFVQSPMGCWGVIPCSQATLPRILRKAR